MLTKFLVKIFSSNPDNFLTSLFQGKNLGGLPREAGESFAVMQIFFAILDTILILGFLFALIEGWRYRPHYKSHGHKGHKQILTLRDELVRERWFNVLKRAAAGTHDAMKIAVIDADKLVDDSLKQLGLQGEHMADRLEKISNGEVKSLERLWRAHRLRNNLVHSPGFELSPSEAKQALANYEAFLKEINVLE